MKKIILLLFVSCLLLCGCSKEKTLICKKESNEEASGYSLKSQYDIHYEGSIVLSVDYTEEITSTNNTILKYFETNNNEQYKSMSDLYGGYTYKVTREDNKVKTIVTIDYKVMNLIRFIDNNPALRDFVNKENKMTVDGIRALYESTGATCNNE